MSTRQTPEAGGREECHSLEGRERATPVELLTYCHYTIYIDRPRFCVRVIAAQACDFRATRRKCAHGATRITRAI
jgi:hypothetical protein